MRKTIIGLFALLLISVSLPAQTGKDAYKAAKKAFTSAFSQADSEQKRSKLEEAAENAEVATTNISEFDAKTAPRVWNTAAETYLELSKMDFTSIQLGQVTALKYPEYPMKTMEAAKKAIEAAGSDKKLKRDKKDAYNYLAEARAFIDNAARMDYQAQNYAGAYKKFNAILDIANTINDNVDKEKKVLANEDEMNEHMYLIGLSASMANLDNEALTTFSALKERGYDKPTIYDALYKLTKKTDKDAAVKYLEEGRQKYPEDESLRIAEINYYLEAGKLDELVGKLKDAISRDKENISLYNTLGFVFDNIFQREAEKGNAEAAQTNFDSALEYYQGALKIDETNSTSIYSIGALYYNKAALMTKELSALEGDYSKAGLAKYDEKKKQVFAAFDEALPFFKKAEMTNPNDMNTLIALKEIYARKDDLEASKAFKERLEKVKNGEKLDKSYFNK